LPPISINREDDARITPRGLAARNRRKTGKTQTNLASVIVFFRFHRSP
jgi:hypothetical protein